MKAREMTTEELKRRLAFMDKLRVRSRGLAPANAALYLEVVEELKRRGELKDPKDKAHTLIVDDPFAPMPEMHWHHGPEAMGRDQFDAREFMMWFTKTWKL